MTVGEPILPLLNNRLVRQKSGLDGRTGSPEEGLHAMALM